MSELTDYVTELQTWVVERVKYIDATKKKLEEDMQHYNSGLRQFDVTEQEERQQRDRETEHSALYRERDVYAELWRKLNRELELDKFLADVQTWLPQGQERRP